MLRGPLLAARPAYFIDVLSRAGEPVSQDLMIVEGRLFLLESDPDNFFFRLSDARRVRAQSIPERGPPSPTATTRRVSCGWMALCRSDT